jgi:hypothetical protein
MKGVPKAAGNQIFNLHIGSTTNAAEQSCVFFYESVSGICELKCYDTKEQRDPDTEGIKEWLENLLAQVLRVVILAF